MAEADSARLWQKFRLDWNYNSNRIEGNTLTRGETKELIEQGIKPVRMRKDILQMQSHDKAIDVLRDLAGSETPLSEVDIRSLHKTALGENYWTEAITADGTITRREIEIGVYKKRPNMVLKSDGSEYIYATPQEVPARMEATIKRLRKYLKKPDAALHDYLAELHQDFIETHPFDDGNGRVVRLLVNYVCLHLGWPPVIIKSDRRSEYIASLESWNDGDETPFRELMKRELIWSLKKSIAAARGEDIEDDGDLDKEIDLFVQETSPSISLVLTKREQVFENAFSKYIETGNFVDEKFIKLSNFFLSYDRNYNRKETRESCNGSSNQTFQLYDWQGSSVSRFLELTLFFRENDYKAIIEIEFDIYRYSEGDYFVLDDCNSAFFKSSPVELEYDSLESIEMSDEKNLGKKIVSAVLDELKAFVKLDAD